MPEIDFKKWWGSADEISKEAFRRLKKSNAKPSDLEAVLLIELVDGPWAKQAQVIEAIGGRRAQKYGLEIQSILNAMIIEYDKLNPKQTWGQLIAINKEEVKSLEWWEKRKREIPPEDPIKEKDFEAPLSKLRLMNWGNNDRERVRAAAWAVGIG